MRNIWKLDVAIIFVAISLMLFATDFETHILDKKWLRLIVIGSFIIGMSFSFWFDYDKYQERKSIERSSNE